MALRAMLVMHQVRHGGHEFGVRARRHYPQLRADSRMCDYCVAVDAVVSSFFTCLTPEVCCATRCAVSDS